MNPSSCAQGDEVAGVTSAKRKAVVADRMATFLRLRMDIAFSSEEWKELTRIVRGSPAGSGS
jgi:hypothetical protein